ncbi:MAG: FKBP-type peptidylprolyl isomerase [Actinobacteria bacterium]|jgi:peptidylprolyl isomerase|nr:FKBP-type peptidylprolyl isomerase [Actinomycetota bacterium]
MTRSLKSPGLILSISALSLALLTGCSTDGGAPSDSPRGDSTSSTNESGANMPKVSGAANEAPTISAPTGNPPADLVTDDVIVGSGKAAVSDSTLTVHYTLMAWSTGQVVESSWAGEPATFGLNQVITGWQQGIPGMKEGGRRLLVIPPSLGYGEAGGGPIGPNETLIFVVDLIKVS